MDTEVTFSQQTDVWGLRNGCLTPCKVRFTLDPCSDVFYLRTPKD